MLVFYTDHFSGPSRAIDPLCISVCLCFRTITNGRNDFSPSTVFDITLSRSRAEVKLSSSQVRVHK